VCLNRARLRRKAKVLVRFLEAETGLKRAHALSSRIECGFLRSAIRRCFDVSDLNEVDELSIKTAMKVEKTWCKSCRTKLDALSDKWKKERFAETRVDDDHLSKFATALARNVPEQWNLEGVWPYVPNGHATAYNSCMEGGNWNEEPLDRTMSVAAVVSSGKPRIVTAYSAGLTEVLYPLHKALYACFKRKGWLLTGDPNPEQVASLNGRGEYISVDYESATDKIKTAYSRAAVEVLIRKSVGLSETQEWALRSVGELEIDGSPATIGQPMGMMMSFPLLCLINKTCVDLTLNDLLTEGKISPKEWTSHRCLINGDDLLLRSPVPDGRLEYLPRHMQHGEQIGLRLQMSKTKVSATIAEINSTLFVDGALEKKSNAGIFKGGDVTDVLGYCDRSTRTIEGFLIAVRHLVRNLRFQVRKAPRLPLPLGKWRALLHEARVNPKLKEALTTVVVEEPVGNAFPIVEEPPGFDLNAVEAKAAIEARVSQLRKEGYKGEGCRGDHSNMFFTNMNVRLGIVTRKSVQGITSLRKALGRNRTIHQRQVLKVLADVWETKQKKVLVEEDKASGEDDVLMDVLRFEHVCDCCSGSSAISRLQCEIKAFKKRKSATAKEGNQSVLEAENDDAFASQRSLIQCVDRAPPAGTQELTPRDPINAWVCVAL